MYAGPNTLWISADRRTKLDYDGANLITYVDDVAVATIDSTGAVAHKRIVVADALSVDLTAAQSGALCVFDKTDGALFNLPAAAAGLYFDFVIVVAPASVGHRVMCATGDFILGSILLDDTDTGLTTTAQAANGTTHLAIDLDAVTDGWLAGGFFRLTAISTTQWVIQGHLIHTGNVASPFETT